MDWEAVILELDLHHLKFEAVKTLLREDFLELSLSLLLDLENLVELFEKTVHLSLVGGCLEALHHEGGVSGELGSEFGEAVEVDGEA